MRRKYFMNQMNGAEPSAPIGAINGKFTINSNGDQVYFSQGNLQYIGSAATPYWKFAENQWDYFGTSTGQNSSNSNVDRDLFGWGTSGYNHGAICYQPWSISRTTSDYYAYGNSAYNLYDQTGMADWGYNSISNGGNKIHQWRTLSSEEWNYLLSTRNTASGIRFAKGTVNGVCGVILLPDDWNSSYYTLNSTNNTTVHCSKNTITSSDWTSNLESHGAVFLPTAGQRTATTLSHVSDYGQYGSSSCNMAESAYAFSFSTSTRWYVNSTNMRYVGVSVRLVQDIQQTDTN